MITSTLKVLILSSSKFCLRSNSPYDLVTSQSAPAYVQPFSLSVVIQSRASTNHHLPTYIHRSEEGSLEIDPEPIPRPDPLPEVKEEKPRIRPRMFPEEVDSIPLVKADCSIPLLKDVPNEEVAICRCFYWFILQMPFSAVFFICENY